jgi:hypothetical protein
MSAGWCERSKSFVLPDRLDFFGGFAWRVVGRPEPTRDGDEGSDLKPTPPLLVAVLAKSMGSEPSNDEESVASLSSSYDPRPALVDRVLLRWLSERNSPFSRLSGFDRSFGMSCCASTACAVAGFEPTRDPVRDIFLFSYLFLLA